MRSALDRVQEAGDVRVVDALVVSKDRDGAISAMELADVAELNQMAASYGLSAVDTDGLIAAEDAAEVGAFIDPDTTALALLIEHLWARDLAGAVRESGGALMASVRVPDPHAVEALRARAEGEPAAEVGEEP